MSYGLGEYGVMPWGFGSEGSGEGAPVVLALSPSVLDAEGGTVVTLSGSGFTPDMTIEVLAGTLLVLGTAFLWDPPRNLTGGNGQPFTAHVGFPPAPAGGTYHVRITTAGGSVLLTDAVTYQTFAYGHKTETSRRKWSSAWRVGTRRLAQG